MVSGWVKIPRRFSVDLPANRPFTRLEAAYSLALDQFEGREWTLRGYARLWQWSTGKVSRFLDEIDIDQLGKKAIKSYQYNETEAGQKRDSNMTHKIKENEYLQAVTKQRRDENKTETGRTIIEKKREDTFVQFWSAYPRKTGKAVALKIWECLNPSSDTVATILGALDWQIKQPDWQKDSGRYIPHPSTWLNGRRWEDEKPTSDGVESKRLQVVL